MTENWGEILGKWGSVWISDEFELSEFELSGASIAYHQCYAVKDGRHIDHTWFN